MTEEQIKKLAEGITKAVVEAINPKVSSEEQIPELPKNEEASPETKKSEEKENPELEAYKLEQEKILAERDQQIANLKNQVTKESKKGRNRRSIFKITFERFI